MHKPCTVGKRALSRFKTRSTKVMEGCSLVRWRSWVKYGRLTVEPDNDIG